MGCIMIMMNHESWHTIGHTTERESARSINRLSRQLYAICLLLRILLGFFVFVSYLLMLHDHSEHLDSSVAASQNQGCAWAAQPIQREISSVRSPPPVHPSFHSHNRNPGFVPGQRLTNDWKWKNQSVLPRSMHSFFLCNAANTWTPRLDLAWFQLRTVGLGPGEGGGGGY